MLGDPVDRGGDDVGIGELQRVAHIVSAERDDVECIGRRVAANVTEKFTHLDREMEVSDRPCARAAHGVVRRVPIARGERRADARAEPDRFSEILDPGRPVAEMVPALRIGRVRDQREQILRLVMPRWAA